MLFQGFLLMLLPSLISLLLIPIAVMWAAKQAKVTSPKLTYRHQLLNAFVATLIASMLGNVLPLGAIIGYMVFMTVMLQSELKTNWGKTILIAIAGLVVQMAVGLLYVFAIYGFVMSYMPAMN